MLTNLLIAALIASLTLSVFQAIYWRYRLYQARKQHARLLRWKERGEELERQQVQKDEARLRVAWEDPDGAPHPLSRSQKRCPECNWVGIAPVWSTVCFCGATLETIRRIG
jgi:hypothetical protein